MPDEKVALSRDDRAMLDAWLVGADFPMAPVVRRLLAAYDRVDAERLRDAATATFMALDDFDSEALISLLRPGRMAEWKHRLFELRVELEEAVDGR